MITRSFPLSSGVLPCLCGGGKLRGESEANPAAKNCVWTFRVKCTCGRMSRPGAASPKIAEINWNNLVERGHAKRTKEKAAK